jgi:acyl transferase domain-containing protein
VSSAGLLLAAGALTAASAPPVMHLRTPNVHVAAALDDWRQSGGAAAALPRQEQPSAGGLSGQLAGTSSFGMSGVNAHVLLAEPESIRNEVTSLQ